MEINPAAQMGTIDYGRGWRPIGEEVDLIGRARMNQRRSQRCRTRGYGRRRERRDRIARLLRPHTAGASGLGRERVSQHRELVVGGCVRDYSRGGPPRLVQASASAFAHRAHSCAQIENQRVAMVAPDGLIGPHIKTRNRQRQRTQCKRLQPEEQIEP